MQNIGDVIVAMMREVAEMRGADMASDLTADTVLLESGMDSLGFAIVVARLEETLGYDPFVMMDVPVYPRTLGEFADIYQRYAPKD